MYIFWRNFVLYQWYYWPLYSQLKPDDGPMAVVTNLSRVDAVCWSEGSSSSANKDEPARSAINHYSIVLQYIILYKRKIKMDLE